MAMLAGVADLTLARLNEFTQAWVENDYHHNHHAEIGTSPLRRFLDHRSVARDCPDSDTLRRAFRCTLTRRQRRSDGTFTLAGKRFEIPARYRHLETVRVRYARWDLRQVELVDPHTLDSLCALYPLDKSAHADGQRRQLTPTETTTVPASPPGGQVLPPLLRQLLADYAATGRPPAYLPTHDDDDSETTP